MLQQSFHPALADETSSSVSDYRRPTEIEAEVKLAKAESPVMFEAIDRLEETILNSPRVPLTGKTMVNEEELLEQLDTIRLSLPEIVATAQQILDYKDRIIDEAQQQVQQILAEANQRAYQVANELGIIDRSEQEANQIRQMAIAECEQLRQQTITEVERVRNHSIQELERMRQQVTIECQEIQDGADEYADRILHTMEYQLTDVLQSIQRGRQRLHIESDALRDSQLSARESIDLDDR
jgi:cell division septum initiation protein DivIVA